jgi:hypothetical protein
VVVSRYPEAEAAEEVPPIRRSTPILRCCWFIYDGPERDARFLGRGVTEAGAWADAARRLSIAWRRVKVFLAD